MGATRLAPQPSMNAGVGRRDEPTRWRWEDLFALSAMVALGIGTRAFVLRSSLGALNADEATTGLMAQEVLRGRVPLVLAGQNYSGTIESYLYAPLHALLGPSSLALKLIPAVLWFAVSYVTYRIAALVADRRLGVLLGAVVWVSSFPLVLLSTQAYAGYGSGAVAVFVALLLLLQELPGGQRDGRSTWRRLLLGFCTGLAVWSHPMYLATLVPAHLFLAVHKRRDLWPWVLANAAGALAGLSPLLLWNLRNDWASLEIYAQPPSTYTSRLLGFLGDVVPRLLGLRAGPGTWTGGVFGQTLLLALVLAFALALWSIVRGTAQERLIAVVAIFTPLLTAAFPTSWYTGDARYGITWFPVVVLVAGLASRHWRPLRHLDRTALLSVPLLCFAVTCAPALAAVSTPPPRGGADGDVIELVRALDSAGVRHLRSDYWTAQPVTFLSDRRIVASGFDVVRFPELEWQVQQAGNSAAFAAVAGKPRDDELRATLPTHTRRQVARYALYLP